jgi:flavin-dependent dehydrogenase
MVGPIDKTNLCLVMGYFGFCPQSYLEIFKYYHEFPGYAYLFKRKTDCSLGIGTRLTGADTAAMKEHLERFIKRYYPEVKLKTFWSALVPVISNPSFFDLPCCGKNWALIGDAAGHVDPITAEGILYAMWDAELLADAITAGNMAGFDSMWRKEFGHELRHKAKDAEKSYDAKSIERYVWLAKRSRTFGRIMYEYMMHEIPSKRLYATVTWRFPRIIGDIITKNGDKK